MGDLHTDPYRVVADNNLYVPDSAHTRSDSIRVHSRPIVSLSQLGPDPTQKEHNRTGRIILWV